MDEKGIESRKSHLKVNSLQIVKKCKLKDDEVIIEEEQEQDLIMDHASEAPSDPEESLFVPLDEDASSSEDEGESENLMTGSVNWQTVEEGWTLQIGSHLILYNLVSQWIVRQTTLTQMNPFSYCLTMRFWLSLWNKRISMPINFLMKTQSFAPINSTDNGNCGPELR